MVAKSKDSLKACFEKCKYRTLSQILEVSKKCFTLSIQATP